LSLSLAAAGRTAAALIISSESLSSFHGGSGSAEALLVIVVAGEEERSYARIREEGGSLSLVEVGGSIRYKRALLMLNIEYIIYFIL